MGTKGRATPRLVIIEGKEKGKVISVEDGQIVIGRSKGEVIIHDPRISRSHLEINFDSKSGKLTYSDLKSLNGTLVNGKLKEAGELHDGDRIQLGNTTFDCQISVQSEDIPNPPPEPLPIEREEKEKTDSVGPLPLPENIGRREPELGAFSPKSMPPEPSQLSSGDPAHPHLSGSISILKKWSGNLPDRSRKIYAACALVLVLIIGYYTFRGGSNSSGLVEQPRNITSIKRLQSEGKLKEAVASAESVAKTSAQPELFSLLGDLYLEDRQYPKAVEAYKASLNLDAQQGVTLAKLARAFLLMDHADEAGAVDKELEQLIIEGPHSREFLVEVARLYLDFDNLRVPPEKMIILGQALQNKFAPDDPSGFKLEAKGHILKHNSPAAIKILDEARARFPGDDQFYLFSVLARVEVGDFEKADTIIEEWMQKFPKATQPLLFLAEESIAKKEYLAAMKNLQKIVQMGTSRPEDPTLRIAYNRMGKIYALNGQAQDAQEAMRRSCDLGFRPSCEEGGVPSPKATNSPAPSSSPSPSSEPDGPKPSP